MDVVILLIHGRPLLHIFRYIKVRGEMLRKVSTKQVLRLPLAERRELEKQVKELAWMASKCRLDVRVMTCRVKRHITKFKVIHKYVEVFGQGFMPDGKRVTFQLANQYPSPYRMVMYVYKGQKRPAYIHGNVDYCFDILASALEE
jgi:hypothetical protein